MHRLDSPRMRYKFNKDTDKPCSSCIYYQPQDDGHSLPLDCVIHCICIADAKRSTCPSWIMGLKCGQSDNQDSEHFNEEHFRIKEGCPWCDYENEINDVPNCQFEEFRKALEHLVGIHLLTEHPDQIAKIAEVFTGSFQAFCGLAVDAARKIGSLADYGRRSGRVVGKLNNEAKRIGK